MNSTALYTKFSNQRDEKHNIRTNIVKKSDGTLVVVKQPDTAAATEHVLNMPLFAKKLEEKCVQNNLNMRPVPVAKNGDSVEMDFVEGESIGNVLINCLENSDREQFECLVKQYADYVKRMYSVRPFRKSEKFAEVFGDVDLPENLMAADYVDIDLIFQNIIVGEDGTWNIIDYEWTFGFDIPVGFVLWRAAVNFKAKDVKSELYEWFGISLEEIFLYEKMEDRFQKSYLCNGNARLDFLYQKMGRSAFSIKGIQQELDNRDAHIQQLMESERNLSGKVICLQSDLIESQKLVIDRQGQLENRELHIQQLMSSENKLLNVVAQKDRELLQKNSEAERLGREIVSRDAIIQNLNNHVNGLSHKNSQLQEEVSSLKGSRSWRFTKPLRSFGKFCRNVKIIRWPVKFLLTVKRNGIKATLSATKTKLFGVSVKSFPHVEVPSFNFPERNHEWMGEDQRFNLHLFPMPNGNYERFEMPKFKKPLVSIVVPVYNQFEYTFLCLKAIKAHSGDVPYEVIIADDHSNDLTKKIKKIIGNLKVVRNRKNLRFLKNCNKAAKYAKGKYILFLNNDTQVQPNWLKPLVDLIESKDDIGMVGSKFVYPDGTLQEAGGIVWKDASAWNYGHGDRPYLAQYSYVKEADYISGASIMIKADLWKKIRGFDEAFAPAYCEDTDLAFEIRKRGQKVMFQPVSVVVHFEGKSNGTDLLSGQKAYQVINQKKFYEKWRDVLEKEHEPNAVNVFTSRDRTKGKRTILVIDHYVPTFDMDAGSRTTFMYLKIFVQHGFNVKFIGDNYAIQEPYTSVLNQLGIEVLYGAWYAQNWQQWILENKNNIDVVFFERPHITVKYIDFVKENIDATRIYYGHDLHFLRMGREAELKNDKALLAESEKWKDLEFGIMRKMDVAYYPSEVEVHKIKELDGNINAKGLLPFTYDGVNLSDEYDAEERGGILFVGGFMHVPNVDAMLWFAKEVFPKLNKKHGIKLYIAGSHPPKEITDLNSENIIVKGFVSDEELETLYKSCRIAVVPLRYGAGIKGKVLEALKNGIPLVTTSIGAEGVTGIENVAVVEDDADAMAKKIEEIYDDENTLAKMSADSKNFIAENYTLDAAWNLIKEDFLG